MPSFDYISSPDFRASIESDYEEMRRCADAGAWKSSQVLAGSIVEALLVDYLQSSPNPSRAAKDPLKLDLADAIAICRAENSLSQRTAELCSVIRSYRNLIHPGRMVRLEEVPPNKNSSDIAMSLIELVVAEIAKTRRAAVGLTAEQIASKLSRDTGAISILPHLLKEVSDYQRERLLLEVLPSLYLDALNDEFANNPGHLATGFRIALDSASAETKKRVAKRFVAILREEDGTRVAQYRDAFFRATELSELEPAEVQMVKAHLLTAVGSRHARDSLGLVEGISSYLEPDDAAILVDPFVRALLTETNTSLYPLLWDALIAATSFTKDETDKRILRRLDDWIRHYEERQDEGNVQALVSLKKEVIDMRFPF